MSLQTRGDAQQRRATDEVYSIADHDVQESYVSGRSAAGWVPFFLPHLRPGMSLLDCGSASTRTGEPSKNGAANLLELRAMIDRCAIARTIERNRNARAKRRGGTGAERDDSIR